MAQAAGALVGELSQLRSGQVHEYPDSNAWAVNGPAVARSSIGGGALLGGDPHLPQTLPSVWYEVALSAPGYRVAGATVPACRAPTQNFTYADNDPVSPGSGSTTATARSRPQ